MDWFRSWHGAPTDPKWLLIAKRSETQAGIVSAIVWALFDHASQNATNRGNVEAFDTETYAAFSGFDETTIKRVIQSLKEKNLIIDGHLAAWEKRQPKREDTSTERVKKHRNAKKHNETQETDRAEQIRGDKSRAAEPLAVSNSEKVLRTDLMEAFGPSRTPDLGRTTVWLSKGYSPTLILETVREVLSRGTDVASLNYFDEILAEKQASRPLSPSEMAKVEAEIDFDKVVALFKKGGPWSKYAGPEPGQIGCKCPPEILAKYGIASPSLRRMDS